MNITLRRATPADLPAINAIYYEEETRGEPSPPASRPLGYFAHVQATGELHVAERDNTVIGFAGRIVRGSVAFLTDLFVRPDEQSRGVGSLLLRTALPDDGSWRCTSASSDPRALALYARAGLRPLRPTCALRAVTVELRPLMASDVTLDEADPADPALARWDAEIAGFARPQEHAYWYTTCRALPMWLRRGDATLGYAFVQRYSDGAVWHPDAWTLGPLGVSNPTDALSCLLATVAWARTRAPMLRLFLPGPHPALAPLLAAGFHITYTDTFCSSSPAPLFDALRYVSTFDLL
jgi:GNAT superfamily N-acetyltransferase